MLSININGLKASITTLMEVEGSDSDLTTYSSTVRRHARFFVFLVLSISLIIGSLVLLKQMRTPHRGAYLQVETNKSSYDLGEDIQVTIICVNDQDAGIFLPSLSYNAEISRPQGVVFIMMIRQTSQGPIRMNSFSKQLVANYTWNQKGMDRNQVPRNTYTIRICLSDSTLCGSTTIKIS